MEKFCSYLRYTCRNRKLSLVFIAFIATYLIIDLNSGWVFSDPHKIKWDNDFNHVVAGATLLVAIAVWFAELSEEWRNQLPKRLTVKFDYQHNIASEPVTVMRCEKAHLSGVADIRSLGQQIGSQLVNPDNPDRQLSFRAPFVKQEKGNIEHSQDTGFYYHYRVTFTLNSLPTELEKELNEKGKECKCWVHPFDKTEKSISFV